MSCAIVWHLPVLLTAKL